MYSDEELAAAVRAGVLTEESVAALRSYVAELRRAPTVDEEHFRLVTGFNDIFVVIACALLLAAVAWIAATSVAPWFGAIAQALAAWGLAEFFTRRRRMALPSIALVLAFVGGILVAGRLVAGGSDLAFGISCALAAAAAWLHWLRFKVPITVAAGIAALVCAAVSMLFAILPQARAWSSAITLAAGIAVFATAMRWDASDTLRQTRRSDAAFWLHLLAAPLLVHPIFSWFGIFGGGTTAPEALMVLGVYVAIALVSLSIDRRALMVSALVYVLYAFSALLERYGVVSLSFAVTALAIGAALLMLSAFWQVSRATVLRYYPHALRKWVAPVH